MTDVRLNVLGQPVGAPLPGWHAAPRPPRTPIEAVESAIMRRTVFVSSDSSSLPLTGAWAPMPQAMTGIRRRLSTSTMSGRTRPAGP